MPLLTPLRRLFEAPVTPTYTGFTLLLSGLAGSLVFASSLPNFLKYLLMLATLSWLARLCDSRSLRWGWLASVGLLVLGASLEVGTWLAG